MTDNPRFHAHLQFSQANAKPKIANCKRDGVSLAITAAANYYFNKKL